MNSFVLDEWTLRYGKSRGYPARFFSCWFAVWFYCYDIFSQSHIQVAVCSFSMPYPLCLRAFVLARRRTHEQLHCQRERGENDMFFFLLLFKLKKREFEEKLRRHDRALCPREELPRVKSGSWDLCEDGKPPSGTERHSCRQNNRNIGCV